MSVQSADELELRIRHLAERDRTTPDQVVRDVIPDHAKRIDARECFEQEADASWDAYRTDGLHLTGDELSAWLATMGTDEPVLV